MGICVRKHGTQTVGFMWAWFNYAREPHIYKGFRSRSLRARDSKENAAMFCFSGLDKVAAYYIAKQLTRVPMLRCDVAGVTTKQLGNMVPEREGNTHSGPRDMSAKLVVGQGQHVCQHIVAAMWQGSEHMTPSCFRTVSPNCFCNVAAPIWSHARRQGQYVDMAAHGVIIKLNETGSD